MTMDRRGFLRLLGSAVAVGTAGLVAPALIEEPRRRIWQVGRNAPVQGRWMAGWDPGSNDRAGFLWAEYDGAALFSVEAHETREALRRDLTFFGNAIAERPLSSVITGLDHETLKLWRDASAVYGGTLTRESLLIAIDRAAESRAFVDAVLSDLPAAEKPG